MYRKTTNNLVTVSQCWSTKCLVFQYYMENPCCDFKIYGLKLKLVGSISL